MPTIPLALLMKTSESVGNEIGLNMCDSSATKFVKTELQSDNELEKLATHGIMARYSELVGVKWQ